MKYTINNEKWYREHTCPILPSTTKVLKPIANPPEIMSLFQLLLVHDILDLLTLVRKGFIHKGYDKNFGDTCHC